jgi:hypothetical protein
MSTRKRRSVSGGTADAVSTGTPRDAARNAFHALCARAAAGQQIARLADLIRGCPLLSEDVQVDARLREQLAQATAPGDG